MRPASNMSRPRRQPQRPHRGESEPAGTTRRTRWSWIALLVGAIALTYWNGLDSPFIWDDQTAIIDNQTIRSIWPPWKPLSTPLETPVSRRPLVNLSFALNYWVNGLDVRGYHLVNLGLHLLTACLLFAVIRRALAEGTSTPRVRLHDSATALLATLWWAVHPMVTEIVNYTTQRTTALASLLLMTTVYAAQRALVAHHRRRWHVIAALACAGGMASKEFVAVAPLIVLHYDRVFAFRSFREAIAVRKRLYAALAGTWILLGVILVMRPHSSVGFSAGVDPWTYALNQSQMIVHYLRQVVWPDALILDYGVPRAVSLGDVWVNALGVTALVAASVVATFRWPRVGFVCVAFFLLLAPTSSFVPIATEVGAERRMYLPLAALAILAAASAAWLIDRVRARIPGQLRNSLTAAAVVSAALSVAVLGVLAAHRNDEFKTGVGLWGRSVERWPHGRARSSYAAALMDAGDQAAGLDQLRLAVEDFPRARFALGTELAAAQQYDEAARELTAFLAVESRPADRLGGQMLLGQILTAQGRVDDAVAEFRALVDAFPSMIGPRERLADTLLLRGTPEEAIVQYRELLHRQPSRFEWHLRLAQALGLTGRADESAAYAEIAVTLQPRSAVAHNTFGVARAMQGRLDDAMTHFRESLAIDPGYADARSNLARAERLRP